MHNTDFFKNKRVTIVGLARSGVACAALLDDLGARVSVTDNQDTPATKSAAAGLGAHVRIELGRHTPAFFEGSDLVVASPGVARTSPAMAMAAQYRVPVVSEIEIGWMLCPATFIAVTGSSGKTTVTTLIGMVLAAAGNKAFVCGNIGTPLCREVPRIGAKDFVSLEVSSFQLEGIRDFRPKVALILNFSRNHLDRHKDMQEYLDAKKRIFMNQAEGDVLVVNGDDALLGEAAGHARSEVRYFRAREGLNPNQAAVLEVAGIFGIQRRICDDVFASFAGLEHRFERVGVVGGVTFINDSKATVAESTLWALQNISHPVFLIAGGRDKGIDYRVIAEEASKKVREAVLIGEAAPQIEKALGGTVRCRRATTLDEAVRTSFERASPGDFVLLSPMCSSFDMFTDYEARGRAFKDAVKALSRSTA